MVFTQPPSWGSPQTSIPPSLPFINHDAREDPKA